MARRLKKRVCGVTKAEVGTRTAGSAWQVKTTKVHFSKVFRFLVRAAVAFLLLPLSHPTASLAQDRGNATALPHRIRVSPGVMSGLLRHATVPVYPEQAQRMGIRGDVLLQIILDEDGKVIQATLLEGDPLLAAASMDALREFRFEPFLLNGSPVLVESRIEFRFSLFGEPPQGKVERSFNIQSQPQPRSGAPDGEGVFQLRATKISGTEPQLPPELGGLQGSVYLALIIGTDGRVRDVSVVGGDEPLVSLAVTAVRDWVFQPALRDGKPVSMTLQQSFHFGNLEPGP